MNPRSELTGLSSAEARRLALASLGFAVAKPVRAGTAQVRATVTRLGAIQVDPVNVLARAHYVTTFSRCGASESRSPAGNAGYAGMVAKVRRRA